MIVVTGTKRSGTSLWMHVLVAAGFPMIGERHPGGWGDLLRAANPDGFFESELVAGINFRSNPHPLTGAYLAPEQTRRHAVKVFIPGLVRSDVAFLDRCIATVRDWRSFVVSSRRVHAMARAGGLARDDLAVLPPALEWWCSNFALVRDLAVRGYPIHVLSYASLLQDPARVVAEVLAWIGEGDASRAIDVVRPERAGADTHPPDVELADDVEPRHLAVFDELYAAIDDERPLDAGLVERLNRVDAELRPRVLEHQARAHADTVADLLGRT